MIGILPKSLEIGGRQYGINSDFRIILNLFEVLQLNELTDLEKAYITVNVIYTNEIPDKDFEEAVKKAYWFCDGGDMPKSEPAKVKTLDWKHDESIIFPAVNKAAGCEVRAVPYMHWWTFLGFLGEVGEGLFSTVMNIRQKRAEGKKLDKWERDFLRKHKEMIILYTDEERQAIEETEAFLKTIT